MNGTIVNVLRFAEELLREKKYKDTIIALGEIDRTSISPDDKAMVDLLLSEANLYLGNLNIDQHLQPALDYFRKSAHTDRFARAKFLHGWQLTALGRFFEAKEVLLEAYVSYKRCDKRLGQARALNRLGFIAFHTGDVPAALGHLKMCIEVYDDLGDEANKTLVSINLAQLHFAIGDIGESIRLYNRIRPAALKSGDKDAGIFQIMSAVPYALKGDFDLAHRTLDTARPLVENYPRELAILFEQLGLVHVMEERFREAEEELLKGLTLALDIAPRAALVAQIKRLLGEASLRLNKPDQARSYAREALAIAEGHNERPEIAACHRLLARLACREGDRKRAKEHFKEATDLYTMIRAEYELALTRYYAAASGLYLGGERLALLFMAREYFEKEDITFRLDQIEAETRIKPGGVTATAARESTPRVVAVNNTMRHVLDTARHVAASDISVLLTGPTGTGKDLLARFIHHHSGRAGRFVTVNAAAIPDGMIEAELFGHRKGAYTGAESAKMGLIEEADGGTFYLNEIADASLAMQAKLLDVLESKRIRRLGETKERRIDFRLIAATNHNLEDYIRDNSFRPDLYHRLREIPITLPPLDERPDDIPALVKHFLLMADIEAGNLESTADFEKLVGIMSARDWPGNVRQLEAEIKRLALLAKGNIDEIVRLAGSQAPSARAQLLELLHQNEWNRREVARILGVSDTTVRNRIKRYNISPDALR